MLNDILAKNQSSDKLYVEDVFSTYLYTGNGSTQTITNGIDLAGKGGMVWLKNRNSTEQHRIYDTTRDGALSSEQSNPQSNGWVPTYFNFNSNGFFVNASGGVGVNTSTNTYASWTFRKAPKFFDVVTWSGNSTNRTISHSLGSVPGMIIVKRTDTTADWQVYHRSLANTEYAVLNTTAAKATGATRWNSTTATDTVFSLGTDSTVNATGGSYVAYLFAHDTTADGVIQCGSFTTDGSGNATVNLGYEPQFILYKRTDAAASWAIYDTMRGWAYNNTAYLLPNTSNAEGNYGASDVGQPTATGFNAKQYGANGTFIYMAIRRGPMRVPTDATKVYKAITRAGTGAAASISTVGFPPDLILNSGRTGNCEFAWADKLRGRMVLRSAQTSSETDLSSFPSDDLVSYDQNGFSVGPDYNTQINQSVGGRTEVYECLRRAPGFFDVVCYTGTGSARTVSHNLGVAPELMIVKTRSTTGSWAVYSATLGNAKRLALEGNAAEQSTTIYWNSTSPTTTDFTVGTSTVTNGSGSTYVAYLFASCPGVSKVGSYTGTGTTKQIDCGFTNGARFVLIKRTDSTGDWYVYDSARGIVSGNDPYLLLNSTDVEVTNTDYVDAYSAGFELSSTAPAALNANGGTYIYLAIA